MVDVKQEIIDAQDAYIKLLGKELDDNASFLYIHHIFASDAVIKEGKRLRSLIATLKETLMKEAAV